MLSATRINKTSGNVLLRRILWCQKQMWPFNWYFALNFLGAFVKLRRATMSFTSVRPSSGNDSAPTRRIVMKFDNLNVFRKSVETLLVSLIYVKNNSYCTWRRLYVCDTSLNSSWNEDCFRQKSERKWKHTFYVYTLKDEMYVCYQYNETNVMHFSVFY
jgi:hypothetical protein